MITKKCDALRVLLINPQYNNQLSVNTGDVSVAMERKPPLGILSIGSYLKEHTAFIVQLLDNQLENFSDQEFADAIETYQPHIVGITVVSFKLFPAYTLTQAIKKQCPSAHVCWGGPHVSIYPHESLALHEVDSLCVGDGEVPFLKLCQSLHDGKGAHAIKGIITPDALRADTQVTQYRNHQPQKLPLLDITLLPSYERYRAFLTHNLMATAITSRGCPHRCIFCRLDFQDIQLFPIERVIEQIEIYLALGFKEIELYDETFNITVERVMEFSRLILEKGLEFTWSFRGRVNAVSEEMLALAKRAGCQRIQYGVEAGTDRVLKILQKGTTVAMIRRCFELTNAAGIETVAYLIIGSPGETLEEVRHTRELIKEIEPTYVDYNVFTLFPGTQSYAMAREQGLLQKDYWQEYASAPCAETPFFTWTKEYSFEQLEKTRKKAMRAFYFRPRYILKKIMRVKIRELPTLLKNGFAVLKSAV